MKTISLVIPVYNGEKILSRTFAELNRFFESAPYLNEVVFVNDGSKDTTAALIEAYRDQARYTVRLINQPQNKGKGFAVYTGVLNAGNCDYVFFSDDDLPFGTEPMAEMYNVLTQDEKVDMVTADRTLVHQTNPYPLHRRIGSVCYGLVLPKFIGRKFPDMHAGTKGFKKDVAQTIFKHIKNFRWSFDPEIFLIANANKFKVARVPVTFMPHVTGTNFKLSDCLTVGKEIAHMHWQSFLGKYKIKR